MTLQSMEDQTRNALRKVLTKDTTSIVMQYTDIIERRRIIKLIRKLGYDKIMLATDDVIDQHVLNCKCCGFFLGECTHGNYLPPKLYDGRVIDIGLDSSSRNGPVVTYLQDDGMPGQTTLIDFACMRQYDTHEHQRVIAKNESFIATRRQYLYTRRSEEPLRWDNDLHNLIENPKAGNAIKIYRYHTYVMNDRTLAYLQHFHIPYVVTLVSQGHWRVDLCV